MSILNDVLAKSKKYGEIKLIDHTKAVISVAYHVLLQFLKEDVNWDVNNITNDELIEYVISSAALHDIGKCSKSFQRFCESDGKSRKRPFCDETEDGLESLKDKNIITHNILSWAYALTKTNLYKTPWVLSSILYHHVVYGHLCDVTARNAMIDLDDDEIKLFDTFLEEINSFILMRFGFTIQKDNSNDGTKMVKETTLYHDIHIKDNCVNICSELDINALYTITRTVLVFADRLVSSHPEYSTDFIGDAEGSFIRKIYHDTITVENMPSDNYDMWALNSNGEPKYDMNRILEQNSLMEKISKCDNNIVNASTGFGKTLIGLRWIMRNKTKTLWVTPRNVIANSTYNSIIDELNTMGYKDKITVGLLLHGEYLQGNENSDIIVTNIDNFLSVMVKNNMAHNLIKEIGGNIIFDEYHEFLCDEPLFAAFISYAYTRINKTYSKTLFLSATAIRFNDFFGWNNINFIKPKVYNGEMNVNVHIKNYDSIDDFILTQTNKDALVITHTVKQAQGLYKKLSNDISDASLLHAMFTDERRNEIEELLYKKHGKKSPISERNTVIGTNVLSTGLNISARNIYDFIVNPEGTIQRGCGRGGRFGELEYDSINYYVCSFNKDASSNKFISSTYSKDLYNEWYDKLKVFDGKTITKNDLYDLYEDFYDENLGLFIDYMFSTFMKSAKCLRKFTPYATRKKDNDKSLKNELSRKYSFRGENNNIYVSARYVDDEERISEPIIVDTIRIKDNECREKDAQKFHYHYFKKNSNDSFKYIYKDYYTCFPEDWFRLALSYNTPLVLYYARYSDELGLIL